LKAKTTALGIVIACVASIRTAAPSLGATGPVRIGSRLELFVDDFLIDKMEGAELALGKPTPREVAVVHDKPWEGNVCCYHTVFQDGDLYRMYYRGAHYDNKARKSTHRELVCCAVSKDGIHWTKPEFGIVEFDGSKKNNIVWDGIGGHNFAPFKDPNPKCKPDEKYKAIASGKGGLYAFKSPDAIHWSLMSEKPVITEGAFDSQNLAFWDSTRNRYVDFHRGFRAGHRDIMTCHSKDFLTWTKPVWLAYPGSPPEHLYTNQIKPYFRAPHIFMGFPKRFVPSRQPMSHRYPGVSDGVFMTSRDGLEFKRWGEAFVRPGPQKVRWVNRNNMTAWGILKTKSAHPGTPDELSIYSTEGYYRGDSCQIRRYTIRIDGFVSVRAPLSGGTFTTKPLVFDPPAPDAAKKPKRPGPIAVDSVKPMTGKRSLRFDKPAFIPLPGTKDLGKQATFAVQVRGVPAGHRRLFSAYDGGPSTGKEFYFDIDSDGNLGDSGMAIRFAYDGTMTHALAKAVGDWSTKTAAGKAHHIAATWDDGKVKLYFDGKEVASGGEAGLGALEFRLGDVRFGEDYPPTLLTNEPFLGGADDVLVLRRVLTSEEIKAVAERGADAALKLAREKGIRYTMETDEVTPTALGPAQLELIINYATSAAGGIRCEILDPSGKPVPGYGLGDCEDIYGDDIERPVSWGMRTEVKQFAGKPVRLRFHLKDADLYSIRFR